MDRVVVCAWCPEDRQKKPGAIPMASGICPTCVEDFAGFKVDSVELEMRRTDAGGQLPRTTIRLDGQSLVFPGRPGPLLRY